MAGIKRDKTMISMMSQRIGKKMIRKLNGISLLALSWINQTTSETMSTPSVEASNRKKVPRFKKKENSRSKRKEMINLTTSLLCPRSRR